MITINKIQNTLNKLQIKWIASYKLNKVRKLLYRMVHPCKSSKVIFVFGCQRSGTTMLANAVGLSPLVELYGEGSPPYFFQKGEGGPIRRLKEEGLMKALLQKEKSKYILLKPLYESHRADYLLDLFTYSKGIWIFRNFLDVVDSHINYYKNQNGVEYISDLLTRDRMSWKNEVVPEEIKEILECYSNERITAATAYAIFWLARNSLYFLFKGNPNLLLVNYEILSKRPVKGMQEVFSFIGLSYRKRYAKVIHSKSVQKRFRHDVDKRIMKYCEIMYERLYKEAMVRLT